MRKEKELMSLLRGLVELLAEEADRNPVFGDKLEHLLTAMPARKESTRHETRKRSIAQLPDLHVERATRGEADFLLWLREFPVPVLKSIIRANDFDPAHRTSKWSESEKLATFIADGLRARMSRGSAFMGKRPTDV
jgi:hypothetical protein